MKLTAPSKLYAVALFILLFLIMHSIGLSTSTFQEIPLSPLTGGIGVNVAPASVSAPPQVSRAREARPFLQPFRRNVRDRAELPQDRLDDISSRLSGNFTAGGYDLDSEQFKQFVQQVINGQKEVVRGLYVEELLALPVVQQPAGDPGFVSNRPDTATEFLNASSGGVIGLLAHNYLAGRLFYNLQVGQDIRVVFGDGSHRHYRISGSYGYQKLTPNNLFSELIELSSSQLMTSTQVFNRYYRGEHHLTLQTCLQNGAQSNWGLTFWIAEPKEQ